MQLKQLFADEDAVSPVIGVILMVAITVILAAVIGTFVLGLGDNVQDNGPTANFQFDYSGDFSSGTDTGLVEVTHNGGDNIDPSNVKVIPGSGTTVESFSGDWTSTISTGSVETFGESGVTADNDIGNAAPGDTIRIVWEAPSGGSSSTIGQSDIPN